MTRQQPISLGKGSFNMNHYTDEHGREYVCLERVAPPGGQGVVYRTEDADTAVKLELKNDDYIKDPSRNERYKRLRRLPVPFGLHVTMPQAVLRDYSGYVMRLLNDMIPFSKAFETSPADAKSNEWIMKTFEDEALQGIYTTYLTTGGARRRLDAYLRVARISAMLHGAGLVYCDYSENNLFISSDPDNVTVWLIDADNLGYRSELHGGAYTKSCCAPEAPLGKLGFYSDCYAFAVLLYKHLMMIHPFYGPDYLNSDFEETKTADERLSYGEFAWICDPDDESNKSGGPIPAEYVMGEALLGLFQRTFSALGRQKPATRPSMMEWVEALARQLDRTVRCPHCEMDYSTGDTHCPWCDNTVPILCMRSYHSRNGVRGAMAWETVKEYGASPVSVALRAVTGDSVDDSEDAAFSVEITDGGFWFSRLSINLQFFLAEEELKREISGAIELKGSRVEFLVKDKKKHMEYVVEVERCDGTE